MPTPIRIMPFGDSITTCCHECQVQSIIVPSAFKRMLSEPRRPWKGYINALWDMLLQDGIAPKSVKLVGRKTECMRNGSKYPMRVPREWDLQYEGYYGHTSRQLSKILPGALIDMNPHIILLHAGTNDIIEPQARHNRPRSAVAQLRYMVNLALRHPTVQHVLIAQIIPVAMWQKRARRTSDYERLRHTTVLTAMEREIVDLNNLIFQQFTKTENRFKGRVHVVDMYSGFNITTDLHGDGLHPNERGEKHIAKRWREALLPLLGVPVNEVKEIWEEVSLDSSFVSPSSEVPSDGSHEEIDDLFPWVTPRATWWQVIGVVSLITIFFCAAKRRKYSQKA